MQKQKLFFIFGLLFVSLFQSSCKKMQEQINPSKSPHFREGNASIVINRGGGEIESQEYKPTVLGVKRANPYTVANMTAAYNNLYSPNITALPATHLYVRFLPNNVNELNILMETGVFWFDYPMDYTLTHRGDFYHDPSIVGEFTWLYASVPVGFRFPSIRYETLAELVLAPDNSDIVREAYYLVGLAPAEFVTERENGPNPNGAVGISPPCAGEDPGYPDCFGTGYTPSNPAYPGGLGGSLPQNACHCNIPASETRPSGCVRVEDTQLNPNMRAVREATVVAYNGWFTLEYNKTNAQGHFVMNQDFASPFAMSNLCPSCNGTNKVQLWVGFTNQKADIRCIRQWDIHHYAMAVYDYLGEFENTFNDVEVNYMQPDNLENVHTEALRYWMSATTLNAVSEWHDYATADGILPPQNNIKILLSAWGATGYTGSAPMLHKIFGPNLSLAAAPVGLGVTYGTAIASVFTPFIGPIVAGLGVGAGITSAIVVEYLGAFPPDVFVMYNWDADDFASDRIKEVIYHELSHTVHFRRAGSSFWTREIGYIVANGGYGDGTDQPGASRAALVEGWGYSIGWMLTDRTYGINHSRSIAGANLTTRNRERWIYRAERFNPQCNVGTCSEWMMDGLIYDLTDNNGLNPLVFIAPGVPFDPVEVGYDVQGVTIQQCFNALDNNVESPQAYRDRLIQNINPNAAVTNDIAQLFLDYGYL